ncbi:MAG: hypothetical protein AB1625_06480 [Acidobacteriota bacterium]
MKVPSGSPGHATRMMQSPQVAMHCHPDICLQVSHWPREFRQLHREHVSGIRHMMGQAQQLSSQQGG